MLWKKIWPVWITLHKYATLAKKNYKILLSLTSFNPIFSSISPLSNFFLHNTFFLFQGYILFFKNVMAAKYDFWPGEGVGGSAIFFLFSRTKGEGRVGKFIIFGFGVWSGPVPLLEPFNTNDMGFFVGQAHCDWTTQKLMLLVFKQFQDLCDIKRWGF